MGIRSQLFTEERGEGFNNAARHLRELVERWDNSLTFEGLSFSEGYANGRFAIILYVKFGAGADRRHQLSVDCDLKGKVRENVMVFVLKVDSGEGESVDYRNEEPMFVKNVELVESPEGIISSLVGLYAVKDEIGNARFDSLYFSLTEGIHKILPRFVEREVSGRVTFANIPQHGAEKQIERSAHVVNSITNDKGELFGSGFGCMETEEVLSCFRVYLDSHVIGVSPKKNGEGRFQLIDVALGPFDL